MGDSAVVQHTFRRLRLCCGMTSSDNDNVEPCRTRLGSPSARRTPYFAELGGSALGFYTPQDMLQALLHHRGSIKGVNAVRPTREGAVYGRRRDALHPPAAAARRRGTNDDQREDGCLPPDASLVKSLPPKLPLAAVEDMSISALTGHLQDGIMVGLGLRDLDVRTSSSKSALVRPLFGGRAIFCSHGQDVFVVWAATKDDAIGCFCSCGGDMLNENVGARVRTGESSTCRHAVSLSVALHAVANHTMCRSVPDLLRKHPSLDGGLVEGTDVDTCLVSDDDVGRGTHVVSYNHIFCVVETPATMAKQRRPVCRHVPCRTRNVRCLHSLVIMPSAAGDGAFANDSESDAGPDDPSGAEGDRDAADAASGDNRYNRGDSAGVIEGASQEDGARATPARPRRGTSTRRREPRAFADTDCRRRARNMLPCASETDKCARYDALARGQVQPWIQDVKLHEQLCVHCGGAIGELHAGKLAVLHTLSGRVAVETHAGVCSN